ncbi:hypothetical protein J2128_000527 [Methanomicrobium sp. W14]|uniref:DUF2283 domain-containing protein n=1 Tax=Methanomicrobium sp. W14 TaxID=2817839 RepID=UPI001AE935CC|nr:DUF2283 domain-containing protein [Methanomicrobium sp. W14]MBP2132606.1 hypothetical protein [Methanomicrobium sp. W14]
MAVEPVETDADTIDYGYENDSLFFFTRGEDYSHSLNLDNIIPDLNKENSLKGVEISNASKKFGVSKHALGNPHQIELNLDISDDKIELKLLIILKIRNKSTPRTIKTTDINEYNMPAMNMTMSCGVC